MQMQQVSTVEQEAAEDLFFGQVVIIWARWFLILAGTILILWTTTEEIQLARAILPILALMAVNFFLHGRYLVRRPANRVFLTVASLVDLTIITLIVLFWQGKSGLSNQFFIFYYPVVLAFAFVFPRRFTVVFTGLALIAYAGAAFVADPSTIVVVGGQKALLQRLVTIAAMGGLGTYYWRIQRDRRRAAMGS
jgi:hypothetical protein